MTTQPIDYHAEAAALFARARAALDATSEDPVEFAVVGILGALLALDQLVAGHSPTEADDDDTIELDAAEIALHEARWAGGRPYGTGSA